MLENVLPPISALKGKCPAKRVLLLGGAGPVGTAVLYLLRELGWTAWVGDPVQPKHIDLHKELLGPTLEGWTCKKYELDDVRRHLDAEKFDFLIDLTPTLDKRVTIDICDERDVSLVNSTMVDFKDDIHIAAFNFVCDRPKATRRPHIVASGMNPGAVNAMAEEIIARYEQPDAICYWEHDDTLPCDGKLEGPSTTWSQGEAGDEMTEDWTFEVVEEGTCIIHEDALSWHPQTFQSCGVPIKQLKIPAKSDAMLIGHEECIYMGWRHDTAVKFIYGFHEKNMKLIRSSGYGWRPHLLIQDRKRPLVGRDIMGVGVRYLDDDSWIGSYCELANSADVPSDTNATCLLVASGIVASVLHIANTRTRPGVHLTHELPGWMKAFRSLVPVHGYIVEGDEIEMLGQDDSHLKPAKTGNRRNGGAANGKKNGQAANKPAAKRRK